MIMQSTLVTVGCFLWGAAGQIPIHTLLAQEVPVGSGLDIFWRVTNSLGAMAVLAWYFYWTQTKTIPDKEKQLQAERAASDAKIKATLDASTLEFQRQRDTHKASIDCLVDELKQEREARMFIIQHCTRPQEMNER